MSLKILKTTFLIIIIYFLAACGQKTDQNINILLNNNIIENMKITSTAFETNNKIPTKYTCKGENISPSLSISEVPESTVTLSLIMDDPDAPNKTWVHWVAWNISPLTTEIPENTRLDYQGVTDFGDSAYGGPCPPSGLHRYFFKLYALDTTFDLPETTNKADLEKAMQGHILESAELIGLYEKK